MTSTIDKILDILDQPQQQSTEGAFVLPDTECWRCGCELPEATALGACERCVTDLQEDHTGPKDAVIQPRGLFGISPDTLTQAYDFSLEMQVATREFLEAYMREVFGQEIDTIESAANPAPAPNCHYVDQHGSPSRAAEYVTNPGAERRFPVLRVVNTCQDSAVYEPLAVETYRLLFVVEGDRWYARV